MPPHLLHWGQRCSPAISSDARHSKGDAKGAAMLGFLRGKGHPLQSSMAALGSAGTPSSPLCFRTTSALNSSSHDAAPLAADAAGSPASDDTDWEAVRLMTAASILSSSPSASTQDSIDGTQSALSESSSALPAATVAAGAEDDPLGPLALLDDVTSLDADSLSLAVGILRQRQPVDGSEGDDGVQLSERLRDFLLVLRKRPGSSMPVAAGGPPPPSSAAADNGATTATTAAAAAAAGEDDGFWSGSSQEDEEWGDVRAALMGIGINASLDEEDQEEEDVWALEAGRVETRRTRLLRSLPKLDSSTAQQLTAFLSEVQQHSPRGTGSNTSPAAGAAAAVNGDGAAAVSEEEQQWWQQASLAYSLLREQAGKVQQGQGQQQQEQVVAEQQ